MLFVCSKELCHNHRCIALYVCRSDPESVPSFHQTMIIAACLSHTSATFSLAAMHLTRQFSSRQRDWQGHSEAWQSTPALIRVKGKRRSVCLIWTSFALGGAAQRDQEETKRKALERRPCQAIGLNIIRSKGGEPRVNAPLCLPLANTYCLCPLTSGCTSERLSRPG